MLEQSMNPADLMPLEYFELQKLAKLSNTQSAALFRVNAATIRGWRSTSESKSAPKSVKATLVNIITGKLLVVPHLLAMDDDGNLPALRELVDSKYHVGVSEDHKLACDTYAEHGLSGGGFFESMTEGNYKDAYERAHTLIKPHFDAHMNYTHQFQALLPKDDPLYRPLDRTVYEVYQTSLYPENYTGYVCDGRTETTEKAVNAYAADYGHGIYKEILGITLGQFDNLGNRQVNVRYLDDMDDEESTSFYLVPKTVITAA